MLSNKTPYGEEGADKYYIGYLNGGLRPLHIIIMNIKLYTDNMNVLANNNELLKYGTRLSLFNGVALIKI